MKLLRSKRLYRPTILAQLSGGGTAAEPIDRGPATPLMGRFQDVTGKAGFSPRRAAGGFASPSRCAA